MKQTSIVLALAVFMALSACSDETSVCKPIGQPFPVTRMPFDLAPREHQLLFAWYRLDYPDSSGLYVTQRGLDEPRYIRPLQPGGSLYYSRAVFSFDGSEVYFRDVRRGEILRQAITGGSAVQVTDAGGGALDWDVDPSGKYLVYVNLSPNENGHPPGPGLRIAEISTGSESIVVRGDSTRVGGLGPQWSPTGRVILFQATSDLFFYDVLARTTTRLTHDKHTEFFVGWEGSGDSFFYVTFDACSTISALSLWDADHQTRRTVHADLGPYPWLAVTSPNSDVWYFIDGTPGALESTIDTRPR